MESESGVTGSLIDQLNFWDIQGDQMEGGSGVTRSIIEELLFPGIQPYQMEGERDVTRRIIDDIHSLVSKEIKWKVKVV